LTKSIDLYELGIEEALDNGVSIIEWPEIAQGLLPVNHIDIHITMAQNKDLRNITIDYR
jgi:tRNA threonylcarbamoyladenosine biosynthesis protein TsaE